MHVFGCRLMLSLSTRSGCGLCAAVHDSNERLPLLQGRGAMDLARGLPQVRGGGGGGEGGGGGGGEGGGGGGRRGGGEGGGGGPYTHTDTHTHTHRHTLSGHQQQTQRQINTNAHTFNGKTMNQTNCNFF